MEFDFENAIVIKREWLGFTCPVLRITTERIRLNKIGCVALGKPKNISLHIDFENKRIIVSAGDDAEKHTEFLQELFCRMNWDPAYKYLLRGEECDGKLLFKLESVMGLQKKD